MSPWLIAVFIRPFVMLVLGLVLLYPVRRLVEKRMRPGRLKDFLLYRVNDR